MKPCAVCYQVVQHTHEVLIRVTHDYKLFLAPGKGWTTAYIQTAADSRLPLWRTKLCGQVTSTNGQGYCCLYIKRVPLICGEIVCDRVGSTMLVTNPLILREHGRVGAGRQERAGG